MILTHKISLSLDCRDERQSIDAVQGDTARAVEISLLENGAAWVVPDGTTAVIRYRRIHGGAGGIYDTLPDGSAGYAISENRVTAYLAPQVLAAAGPVELQVTLLKDGAVLTCFSILIHVQGNLNDAGADDNCYVNLSEHIRAEVEAAMGDYVPTCDGISVHIGPEEPEDDNAALWVDTDDEGGTGSSVSNPSWTCLTDIETTEQVWSISAELDSGALSGCSELRIHLQLPAMETASSLVTKMYNEAEVVLTNTMTSIISSSAQTRIYQQLSGEGTLIRGYVNNDWDFLPLTAKKYTAPELDGVQKIVFESTAAKFQIGSKIEIWGR